MTLREFESIILLFFVTLFSLNIQAAVFDVTSTSDGIDATPGDGVCETGTANGTCTLRAAIDEANALPDADTINLPPGTYLLSGPAATSNASGSLYITSGLTIIGAGAATTIVDANNVDRVFVVSTNQPVILTSLAVRNGNAGDSGLGGGIYLGTGVNLTVDSVNINNNSANSGAGIASGSSINLLTIRNTIIENNIGIVGPLPAPTISLGGGLRLSAGTVDIIDSTIRNNTADFGGGIYCNETLLTIDNSTVSVNTANNIIGNNGFGGGGVHLGSGGYATLIAKNSTFSGNTAASKGAGILIVNGAASLYNTTVTDNIAEAGSGVVASDKASPQTLNLENSIIAGNFSNTGNEPDCSSRLTIVSAGYNIIGDDSDCNFIPASGDQVGTAASPIDPLLSPLADNGGHTQTHALLPASPAVDSGDPVGCTDDMGGAILSDQRGLARPVDGGSGATTCDIGAYELYISPNAIAGPDQVVGFGENVTLDGSNSLASYGIDTYSWVEQPGSTVALNNATLAFADFIAPNNSETLNFELTITDSIGQSSSDSVQIIVNASPTANAGSDQIVNSGETVNLDGNSSADSDGTISFSWAETTSTGVVLSDASLPAPSFIAPVTPGIITLELSVTDNHGFTDVDTVNLTVNRAPVANVVAPQTVTALELVELDGSASSDVDGTITSFSWSQVSGSSVTLMNANTQTSSFIAPADAGTLEFLLTITDNDGGQGTEAVIITVTSAVDPNANTTDAASSSGGCSLSQGARFDPVFPVLLLASIGYLWRRRNKTNT